MRLDITNVPLSSLSVPSQYEELFGRTDPAETARIAAEMSKQGLLTPLHVSAVMKVVVGVKQFEAARSLGWETIDVYRHADWIDAATIEQQIIADARGRNLSPLARARCARRLIELQEQSAIDDLPRYLQKSAQARLKRDVAEELDLSPREINRLLRVERTPLAVQLACDSGKLTLSLAGNVAGLPKVVQQEVAAEIVAGVDPETAVLSQLPPPATDNNKAATRRYTRLLKEGRLAVAELADNIEAIATSGKSFEGNVEALSGLRDLINGLIAYEKRWKEKRRNGTANLMALIQSKKFPSRTK